MAGEEMTLGEFVKDLAALLSENGVQLLFKEEAPWHLLLYRLFKEDLENRPAFLSQLKFDWGGPFPKCKELSRYLQFLHSTACVGTVNPSYREMVLKPELKELWLSELKAASGPEQNLLARASDVATEEFALVA